MSHTEKFIQGEIAFESPDFVIRQDQVELENGRRSRREVVCRPDRVLLLPLWQGGVLLKEVERPALGGRFLEAPCAPVSEGQSPEQAAQAMCKGCQARFVGQLCPSPAILQEKVHVFAACCPVGPESGWQAVPLNLWEDWVARGWIKDMRLAAALALAEAAGFWEQEAVK